MHRQVIIVDELGLVKVAFLAQITTFAQIIFPLGMLSARWSTGMRFLGSADDFLCLVECAASRATAASTVTAFTSAAVELLGLLCEVLLLKVLVMALVVGKESCIFCRLGLKGLTSATMAT